MFTGLVETLGTVSSLTTRTGGTRLVVEAPSLAGRWRTGDSIAVNGVCLTALPHDLESLPGSKLGSEVGSELGSEVGSELGSERGIAAQPEQSACFVADLAQETLDRTSLRQLTPGAVVNLELPTPAGAPLGGHVVQGHVDGTGTLISLTALHPQDPDATDWRMALNLPPHLAAQVIPQGSITVDGISLTVASLEGTRAEIAIIPHTYKSTNLGSLKPGASLNIETDVLAKYAAQQSKLQPHPAAEWLTPSYLLANGY